MRVLFVAAEGLPFSKTGGLADVIEALPKALVAQGHEVAVVLPRYRGTQFEKIVLRDLVVPMGKTVRNPSIVEGARLHGVQHFFVDDPEETDPPQPHRRAREAQTHFAVAAAARHERNRASGGTNRRPGR